jgi:hypothetical protein
VIRASVMRVLMRFFEWDIEKRARLVVMEILGIWDN